MLVESLKGAQGRGVQHDSYALLTVVLAAFWLSMGSPLGPLMAERLIEAGAMPVLLHCAKVRLPGVPGGCVCTRGTGQRRHGEAKPERGRRGARAHLAGACRRAACGAASPLQDVQRNDIKGLPKIVAEKALNLLVALDTEHPDMALEHVSCSVGPLAPLLHPPSLPACLASASAHLCSQPGARGVHLALGSSEAALRGCPLAAGHCRVGRPGRAQGGRECVPITSALMRGCCQGWRGVVVAVAVWLAQVDVAELAVFCVDTTTKSDWVQSQELALQLLARLVRCWRGGDWEGGRGRGRIARSWRCSCWRAWHAFASVGGGRRGGSEGVGWEGTGARRRWRRCPQLLARLVRSRGSLQEGSGAWQRSCVKKQPSCGAHPQVAVSAP